MRASSREQVLVEWGDEDRTQACSFLDEKEQGYKKARKQKLSF